MDMKVEIVAIPVSDVGRAKGDRTRDVFADS
jgi:hypothetical protein